MQDDADDPDDGTELVALVSRGDEEEEQVSKEPEAGQNRRIPGLWCLACLVLVAFLLLLLVPVSMEQSSALTQSVEYGVVDDPSNETSDEATDRPKDFATHSSEVIPAPTAAPDSPDPPETPPTQSTPTEAPVIAPTNAPVVAPTASPTKAPVVAPTAKPTDNSNPMNGFEDGFPHVVYDDLHYRRICSDVGLASYLCLTLRFPFEVPLQDPNYAYVHPFTKKYFDMNYDGSSLPILTGAPLETCRRETEDMLLEDAIRHCLESVSNDTQGAAVLVRRSRRMPQWHWYGRASDEQVARTRQFFDGEVALVLGASPSPGVGKELMQLFGNCHQESGPATNILRRGTMICPRYEERRLGLESLESDENTVFAVGESFFGTVDGNPKETPLEILQLSRKDGWKKLRPLTLVLDYPIAHAQDQDTILANWTKVETVQKQFAEYFLQMQNTVNEKELNKVGYTLKRLIVFDGLPQTFPSETCAYPKSMHRFLPDTQEDFLAHGGYEGWKPEYGDTCQGPVPPNAKLSEVNRVVRKAFKDLGFDMRWYGKVWEFKNQFWWTTKGCAYISLMSGGGYR